MVKKFMVEYAGFEPAISYVQGKRGLRAPLILVNFCWLTRIRTWAKTVKVFCATVTL